MVLHAAEGVTGGAWPEMRRAGGKEMKDTNKRKRESENCIVGKCCFVGDG